MYRCLELGIGVTDGIACSYLRIAMLFIAQICQTIIWLIDTWTQPTGLPDQGSQLCRSNLRKPGIEFLWINRHSYSILWIIQSVSEEHIVHIFIKTHERHSWIINHIVSHVVWGCITSMYHSMFYAMTSGCSFEYVSMVKAIRSSLWQNKHFYYKKKTKNNSSLCNFRSSRWLVTLDHGIQKTTFSIEEGRATRKFPWIGRHNFILYSFPRDTHLQ